MMTHQIEDLAFECIRKLTKNSILPVHKIKQVYTRYVYDKKIRGLRL
jgi:hypothetical protein